MRFCSFSYLLTTIIIVSFISVNFNWNLWSPNLNNNQLFQPPFTIIFIIKVHQSTYCEIKSIEAFPPLFKKKVNQSKIKKKSKKSYKWSVLQNENNYCIIKQVFLLFRLFHSNFQILVRSLRLLVAVQHSYIIARFFHLLASFYCLFIKTFHSCFILIIKKICSLTFCTTMPKTTVILIDCISLFIKAINFWSKYFHFTII